MCPRRYELKYVLGVQPERRGTGLALGSAVHSAVEWFFEERLHHDEPSIKKVISIFDADLGAALAADSIEWKDETPQTLREEGAALVQLFLDHHADLDVVEVEVPFELPLVDDLGRQLPRVLIGYLDLVLRDGSVVELKTAQRAYSPVACRTNLQFGAYRTHALHRSVDLELIALVRGGQPRVQHVTLPYDRDLSRWFISVAGSIERAILAGYFPATPSAVACGSCDYQRRCFGRAAEQEVDDAEAA
jgi:hypothetical protein